MKKINRLRLIPILLLGLFSQSCDPTDYHSKSKVKNVMFNDVDTLGGKMKWLGGADGGNWFMIDKVDTMKDTYIIKRFFEDKTLYGMGLFRPIATFNINSYYEFVPICSDEICNLMQGKKKIIFKKIE